MKSFFAFSLLGLMVASAAFGAPSTSRTVPNMGPAGSLPGSTAPDGPADVLIASSINGGTFTNLAPNYAAAFTAGAASVTQITDAADAPFAFPVPFTSAEFGTIAILTNENWWGNSSTLAPEANVSLQDENKARLAPDGPPSRSSFPAHRAVDARDETHSSTASRSD